MYETPGVWELIIHYTCLYGCRSQSWVKTENFGKAGKKKYFKLKTRSSNVAIHPSVGGGKRGEDSYVAGKNAYKE